jgi:hypothetical protein
MGSAPLPVDAAGKSIDVDDTAWKTLYLRVAGTLDPSR